MRLCGISSRFQLLSPCMRQVTHALLTRPPLSHKIFISEENQIECFVRLACVKHAASVHPEPGSNSHVLMLIRQDLSLAKYPLRCLHRIVFTVLGWYSSSNRIRSLNYSLEFSRLFHCLIIKVLVVAVSSGLSILSCRFLFVKNFFKFLSKLFLSCESAWLLYHFPIYMSSLFFTF